MDKVVYALRDVTSTVKSMPLIASSIMSKKIAGGADKILIDIKVGNGAFLTNREDAKTLGDLMVRIGNIYNREVRYVISDMNAPLGYAVGNSLEVLEAIDVLKGKETNNSFVDLCIELATDMVSMGLEISKEEAKEKVIESLNSKEAYKKFVELVEHQGGDIHNIKVSHRRYVIKANKSGILNKISAIEVGKLSLELGAGKLNIKDKIDYSVGVKLNKLVGERVKKGDILATLYVNDNVPKIDIDKIFTIV
jgi:pyrimidine-nucleoside phosphorylase